MAATQAQNLLRQKASTARKERESREMTPARALRLALARTAGALWELPLDVRGIDQAVIGLEDLGDHMSDDMMLLLLDGPDGARGAAAIDRKIVAAMVEVQTIGTISPKEPPEREPTPTDAALIAPWLDGALERADVTLCGGDDEAGSAADPAHDWMIGYRFGAMAENLRALSLTLDAPDLHCLGFELDVGVGMRSGGFRLLMPKAPPKPSSEQGRPEVDSDKLREAMGTIPAELQVVAGRLSITLAQATALKPGDCLPVEELLFARAELRTADGGCHGTARLGKLDGKWAIRLGDGEQTDSGAQQMIEAPQVQSDAPGDRSLANMPNPLADNRAGASLPTVPKPAPLGGELQAPGWPEDLPEPQAAENINFE
ncbi:FliM/FliN family flagellar motor switch protein [Primorskyibacter aestuariivivens]|uniref:FliM/FliN family flagellar motor switch protein n=1 Tax=Primorskyibacter aestuariivivens TaxID=1888912 RepID=UPI0022FFEEB1|nr:FliM/FliN family flagellar motor switch protein [Primorskyibacter aestuariivivens]MDA7427189.1 FliM/FliN family flagellar motor switch protein [Primorskyibacter aestuariivivens]